METITEGILNQYGYSLSWSGTPQPVPIDEIIEFQYGLDIAWESINHFSHDGMVMAAIIPTQKKLL